MCRAVLNRPPVRSLVLKRRLARMNLNRVWAELEEFYRGRTSHAPLSLPEEEQQNRDNEEKERMRRNNAET